MNYSSGIDVYFMGLRLCSLQHQWTPLTAKRLDDKEKKAVLHIVAVARGLYCHDGAHGGFTLFK